jgi:hypothetical protein
MLYRVDYLLAVQIAGLLVGLVLRRSVAATSAERLARAYYLAVSVLIVLRAGAFGASILASHNQPWSLVSGAIGDLIGFLFGLLFGLAARRDDRRALLTDGQVLDAFRMLLAFTFISAALGKALTLAGIGEFFTHSGYTLGFLKFIIIAEAFGAIGLLLRWAVIPAMLGLSVDMFGAVLTHVHNGDSANDSTGAIGLLIRLVALGLLWTLRPQEGRSRRTVRASVLGVMAATLVCVLIAGVGGFAIRRFGQNVPRWRTRHDQPLDEPFRGTSLCTTARFRERISSESLLHGERLTCGRFRGKPITCPPPVLGFKL